VRLGIVSDVHCNEPALRMAIDRMGDVDELLCAGDVVNEYRFSNEVIELLRQREARCVLGNHDLGLLSAHGTRAREAATVRSRNVEYLARQPLSVTVKVDGKTLIMVHASPCEPHTQYVWARSRELRRLNEIEADYIVLGHTHAQMVERVGRALVINPGSAGEPRDHANGYRLSCAVLDTGADEVFIDNYALDEPSPAG
jgi:putative phosphoesterase